MANSHQLMPTPNPKERSLAVVVKNQVLVQNPALPDEGTLYKDFPKGLLSGAYIDKFSGYAFTGQSENTREGDAVLLFAKHKTDEEKEEPFRTTYAFGNHVWPMILLGMAFFQDSAFVQSNGEKQAPRNYYRARIIPSVSEGTVFKTEEFLADSPFEIPRYNVPIPSSVQWDYLGLSGSFPECLHGDLRFPALQTTIIADSSSTERAGVLPGQFFPATNYESWAPYVLSDRFQYTNGAYYRTRVTVFPPLEPDEINV